MEGFQPTQQLEMASRYLPLGRAWSGLKKQTFSVGIDGLLKPEGWDSFTWGETTDWVDKEALGWELEAINGESRGEGEQETQERAVSLKARGEMSGRQSEQSTECSVAETRSEEDWKLTSAFGKQRPLMSWTETSWGRGRRGRNGMLRRNRKLWALLVSDINSYQTLTQEPSPDQHVDSISILPFHQIIWLF